MKSDEIKIQPNYYAIIPANVRYSQIPPNAKLLYGEITALCNKEGYCWATNGYFAELYGVKEYSITRWIADLVKAEFITMEVDKAGGNLRRIWIKNTPPPHKIVGSYSQKKLKTADSTIYNNTSNTTTSFPFKNFWDLYPKKVEKKKSEAKWNRLPKGIQTLILADIPKRKATDGWQRGFIPNPMTYLNGERWNDEIAKPIISPGRTSENWTEKRLAEERAAENPAGRAKLAEMKQSILNK